MHNSFGGGGGGYSSPYPGYVPPSALPYYNGYPGELAQAPGAYYGKPSAGMPGYSTGMPGYPTAPNINNSMYYQQYGLGYQYGYGKYGLGPGLTSSFGYGSELCSPTSIAPSSLGGLQAPTTDLGLTGSMFSKGSSSGGLSSVNKYSNLGTSSPHSIVSSQANSGMSSAIAHTPPSPSPHSLPSSLRGHGATPSPPIDTGDGKKDLDKMRRCQLCGQVFRLMSECLAHMKAVHEAPMSMYGMSHSAHNSQSVVPPHLSSSHSSVRPSSLSAAPDSPLMALERMGWGKDQNLMPSLHASPSPISQSYSSVGVQSHPSQSMSAHQISMSSNPHLTDPRYGDPSQQSAKRLNDFYNSCNSSSSISHDQNIPTLDHNIHSINLSSNAHKSRKSSSYSVSSIIGENVDSRRDHRELMERSTAGDPPQTHSPSLPPSLTPNLPITSTANLPPNLSPNLPPQLQLPLNSMSSHNISSHPPQLAPNIPTCQPANVQINQLPPTLSPGFSTSSLQSTHPDSNLASNCGAPVNYQNQSKPDTLPSEAVISNDLAHPSHHYNFNGTNILNSSYSSGFSELSQSLSESSSMGHQQQNHASNSINHQSISNSDELSHYQQYHNHQQHQLQQKQLENEQQKEMEQQQKDMEQQQYEIEHQKHVEEQEKIKLQVEEEQKQKQLQEQLQLEQEQLHRQALEEHQQHEQQQELLQQQQQHTGTTLHTSSNSQSEICNEVYSNKDSSDNSNTNYENTVEISDNATLQQDDKTDNESTQPSYESNENATNKSPPDVQRFENLSENKNSEICEPCDDHADPSKNVEELQQGQFSDHAGGSQLHEEVEPSGVHCSPSVDTVEKSQLISSNHQEQTDDENRINNELHTADSGPEISYNTDDKYQEAIDKDDINDPTEVVNATDAPVSETVTNDDKSDVNNDIPEHSDSQTIPLISAQYSDNVSSHGESYYSPTNKEPDAVSYDQDNKNCLSYQTSPQNSQSSVGSAENDNKKILSITELVESEKIPSVTAEVNECSSENKQAVPEKTSNENDLKSHLYFHQLQDSAEDVDKTSDQQEESLPNLSNEAIAQVQNSPRMEYAEKLPTSEDNQQPNEEESIGDEDEPGDPSHSLDAASLSPNSSSNPASVPWSPPPATQQQQSAPLQASVTSPKQLSKKSLSSHVTKPVPCTSPIHSPIQTQMPPEQQLIQQQHAQSSTVHQTQPFFQQQKSMPDHCDKNSASFQQSPHKTQQQHSHPQPQSSPYRGGSWPTGYPNSSAGGYQYHQYGGQPQVGSSGMMGQPPQGSINSGGSVPGSNKLPPAGYPHSRYPNQYPSGSYDGRRSMPNAYPGQGHWYPAAPGRGDTKPPWTGWGASQPHGYSQAYFYGGVNPASGSPQHMHQQNQQSSLTPPHHKYPSGPSHQQTSPHSTPHKSLKMSDNINSSVVSPPTQSPSFVPEPIKPEDYEVRIKHEALKRETSPDTTSKRSGSGNRDRPKTKKSRPGPKSRIEKKLIQQQQEQLQQKTLQQQNHQQNLLAESNTTSTQLNGSSNSNLLTPPPTLDSSESSDSEGDQEPKLVVLKPAKRFKGPDGSFVGPKRIKLAKMVRLRQHTRQKIIRDQIKQSELEDQLTQQWVERASVQEGPLANVLLKSSLLLGDNNVEESDVVEEHIASMTAQILPSAELNDQEQTPGKEKHSTNASLVLAGKKPGRKATANKVLHNNNSVVVKSHSKQKFVPKLRAKDFKWSHYIKSMRYWCKDCGHGFKNQRESTMHGEDSCKWNCLYMLECYVSVTDIVQHKLYGNKVRLFKFNKFLKKLYLFIL